MAQQQTNNTINEAIKIVLSILDDCKQQPNRVYTLVDIDEQYYESSLTLIKLRSKMTKLLMKDYDKGRITPLSEMSCDDISEGLCSEMKLIITKLNTTKPLYAITNGGLFSRISYIPIDDDNYEEDSELIE